jgi:hypothetical protein
MNELKQHSPGVIAHQALCHGVPMRITDKITAFAGSMNQLTAEIHHRISPDLRLATRTHVTRAVTL